MMLLSRSFMREPWPVKELLQILRQRDRVLPVLYLISHDDFRRWVAARAEVRCACLFEGACNIVDTWQHCMRKTHRLRQNQSTHFCFDHQPCCILLAVRHVRICCLSRFCICASLCSQDDVDAELLQELQGITMLALDQHDPRRNRQSICYHVLMHLAAVCCPAWEAQLGIGPERKPGMVSSLHFARFC